MITKDKHNNKPRQNLFLGKGDSGLEEFDLIEVQRESWEKFITTNLKDILQEFFPIDDYTGKKFTLYFEDLYFGEPRYTLKLCLQKKLTYDTPVYLKLRLVNKKTGSEKSQDVYFPNRRNCLCLRTGPYRIFTDRR